MGQPRRGAHRHRRGAGRGREAMTPAPGVIPPKLADVITDFNELAVSDRLQLLLEFSDGLPELPARYAEHPELLEPVPECQSPLYLVAVLAGSGVVAPELLHFSAPTE